MDFVWTGLLFVTLLASAAIGWAAQRRLNERHVSRDSVESIRLLMGMLLTFSALVLGLLTSSAKLRFDGYNNDLSAFSAGLIELDHRLRVYGAGSDEIRVLLRRYTAAAIADTWPDETLPSGQYPRLEHAPGVRQLESSDLGDMLAEVDMEIEHLVPSDEFHRQIAARLRNRVADSIQWRWQLIFLARSTISYAVFCLKKKRLAIVFAILGLTAPRNGLVYTVVVLSALSIASPLYLILDYDEAKTGLLRLSSAPMRVALSHMDAAR